MNHKKVKLPVGDSSSAHRKVGAAERVPAALKASLSFNHTSRITHVFLSTDESSA